MSLSICAIFRDEARYLREWIEFHILMGVETFFLYQNNSSDDYMAVLAPYCEAGRVFIQDWPMQTPSQLAAYHHFLNHRGESNGWVAFIDIDEFLFSPRYDTVTEALEILPDHWGAVGVNWMCFGSSGHETYQDLPVTERFTWRVANNNSANLHIKSVIRMNQQIAVGGDPHYFHVIRGTFNESGDPIFSPFTNRHHSDLLRLNHYVTKSQEELASKVAKGRVDGYRPRFISDFDGCQAQDVDDHDIQRFLPQLKERLCRNSAL